MLFVVLKWKYSMERIIQIFRDLMQQCYPRTYRPHLTEDIFRHFLLICLANLKDQEDDFFTTRMYDMDNDGTIDFKVS